MMIHQHVHIDLIYFDVCMSQCMVDYLTDNDENEMDESNNNDATNTTLVAVPPLATHTPIRSRPIHASTSQHH
jgi:hypothetical protein